MNKKFGITFLIIFALVLSMQSAFAGDCLGFTDGFYGTLKINGANAPTGTEIRGMINGVDKGSYTTTVAGEYGKPPGQGQDKLYINCPQDGDLINFEVKVDNNFVDSGETAICGCGDIENLNIDVNAQCQPSQEVCDGVDNDCDSLIDEDYASFACGVGVCQAQSTCVNGVESCNPGAPSAETCDGLDNDCNGVNDNGVLTTFYQDFDSDTYGNVNVFQSACNPPQGYVNENTDCNDNDATVYPGAPELQDGKDNDCDGTTDEGTNAFDDDEDGFSENDGDCDDQDPFINPGEEELCDTIDNDCNPNTGDGVDEPGYGDTTFCGGLGECAATGQLLCINGQMTDTCVGGTPSAETCDGLDNDCNGVNDNDVLTTFYQDFDSDTYGNVNVFQSACNPPQGYVLSNTDCDDNNAAVNPGALEVCNGIDDDCDGLTDEDSVCAEECPDEDQDTVCDDEDICPDGDDTVDSDEDGVPDDCDVCNGFDDAIDSDNDGFPDGCDACPNDDDNDADQDTVCGNVDNCPDVSNTEQTNSDEDGFGDACDEDDDNDGVADNQDNCPTVDNEGQENSDNDNLGDACDNDDDNDGFSDNADNCPTVENADQTDSDGDGLGNVCDLCPNDENNDADDDTICGDVDNCPNTPNQDQQDLDEDGIGSACDEEEDVETFNASVTIYDGWTAFALPFKPIGISNSEALGQAISSVQGVDCDVIMRFNGETQQMEDDILGLADPSFALTSTQAYFIHCDGSGTFNYEGIIWT